MNTVQRQPVISIGVIAGILGAFWYMLVQNEVFAFMTDLESLNAFVYLLIPIIAAVIQAKLVTPVLAPNLPPGTVVNEYSSEPTSVVQPKEADPVESAA